MSFTEKLPTWEAIGVEPPDTKKTTGWQAEDKPPAAWWNWMWNRTYKSIKELQLKVAEKDWVTQQINGVSIPDASLTVKGKTALNSATNSVDETTAATPKAVKTVADSVAAHLADNAKHVPHLGTTTNIGNAYSVATTEIIATNQKFTVKVNVASTGAATLNVSSLGSAKAIKKPGDTNATLKVGVYTFFWDGTSFQLLGEGGGGTATAGDVRATKTAAVDSGDITGTLVTQSTVAQTVTPGNADIVKSSGIYDGSITVKGDPNLAAGNIKSGTTIFGITGSLQPWTSAIGFSDGTENETSIALPASATATIPLGSLNKAFGYYVNDNFGALFLAGIRNDSGKIFSLSKGDTAYFSLALNGNTYSVTNGKMYSQIINFRLNGV